MAGANQVKLNIFRIPEDEVNLLEAKLLSVGMAILGEIDQGKWTGKLFYAEGIPGTPVAWAKYFLPYFEEGTDPKNTNHFAALIFTCETGSYALSFGKSHFYFRPFCDHDFGIELAKRIADEDDARETSSKRFTGRQRKAIKSFSSGTHLNFESGESVDYISAAVLPEKTNVFGRTAKFGASVMLIPDIKFHEIGALLSEIDAQRGLEPNFALPRTVLLSDPAEVEKYDALLLDELMSSAGTTEFTQNSYDLYGVDFVFGSVGHYVLKIGRQSKDLTQLTMLELKDFIRVNSIPRASILSIKVVHHQEDGPTYQNDLKQDLDFILDDDRVILSAGRWMRFNQDYLDFLDDYVRSIEVEVTESQFTTTYLTEPNFNKSEELAEAGYELADKDFSIFKTKSATAIEAWDLKRGGTVYAVKFGTSQKLGYVCDQAMGVLELLRNRAAIKEVPGFEKYCLWLGYRGKLLPGNIADTGSIILKQKIEGWARQAESLGITPVIKLSHRLRAGIDDVEDAPAGIPLATARADNTSKVRFRPTS
ncbi:hypothetical protein E3T55_18740 [Cryobacterium frigoriphilum]|uniref:Sporadically distributed protein, TIGR04141 family n=1 Tax=Cryobacterium frigoriphilum TaxID=1259150 RepID=A0A4R8ZTL2_9MICO|nr:DUF6119 family protein [Cryobacterium frigoriphilum]TFD45374.1 hypothetical protein E3T55_18740 [Cryobacterium frigoriphilum]